MNLGVISDIHGDPLSLELAWSHLIVLGADRIVAAGDLVGYGPYPDRAVEFLERRKIDSVRGNHDRWALLRGPGRADEFGGAAPSARTLEFLRGLPTDRVIEADGKIVVVVHGSPRNDMEYVIRSTHGPAILDALLQEIGADVLIVGHTHAPMVHRSKSGVVVNPGSVISMPVVRTSRSFALMNTRTLAVTFHDVESGRVLDVPRWG